MPQGFNGTRWQSVLRVSNRVGATASALGFPDVPGGRARPRTGLCATIPPFGVEFPCIPVGDHRGNGTTVERSAPSIPAGDCRGIGAGVVAQIEHRAGHPPPPLTDTLAEHTLPVPPHGSAGLATPPCRQSRSGEAPMGGFRLQQCREGPWEVVPGLGTSPQCGHRGRLRRPRFPTALVRGPPGAPGTAYLGRDPLIHDWPGPLLCPWWARPNGARPNWAGTGTVPGRWACQVSLWQGPGRLP